MKIISPVEDKIIVELTEQDLKELDITYEQMDYSTIETRRVIWTVLEAAGKALGRELDPSGRMTIEAFPSNGGCTLCFTLPEAKKYKTKSRSSFKKQPEHLICDFNCIDNLFAAAKIPINSEVKSSLYEQDGAYRLIISSFESIKEIECALSEFGNVYPADRLECEFTEEHWRKLADANALERFKA